MDHLLINESFSAANLSAYSLAEMWPLGTEASTVGGLGLRVGCSGNHRGGLAEASSTVTEQSSGGRKRKAVTAAEVAEEEEDESSRVGSATAANNLSNSSNKHAKIRQSRDKNYTSKPESEASSAAARYKLLDQSTKPSEPPKDYIHVRARRGQATDSHSLAERARREKISERMKILQEIVPGCNKVIGKALVLDEIINYIQSLHRQVEFLSMKLEAVNSGMTTNRTIDGFSAKDPFDPTGMMFTPRSAHEYAPAPEPEWLHMQIGTSFERLK